MYHREIGDDMVECCFHEPVRAVTPGQAVVFYDGGLCGRRRYHNKMKRKIRERSAGCKSSGAPTDRIEHNGTARNKRRANGLAAIGLAGILPRHGTDRVPKL